MPKTHSPGKLVKAHFHGRLLLVSGRECRSPALRNFEKKHTELSPQTWWALRGKQPAKVTPKNGGIRESQTQ